MTQHRDPDGPALGLPHPDTDPTYGRLRAALGATGAGLAPRPGWEQKVWARIDAEAGGAREPAPRWGRLVGGGAMVAAAAVAMLLWAPWRDRPQPARDLVAQAPTIEIQKGTQVLRSTAAAPGDTVVIRHSVVGASVWIYRGDGSLVLACDAIRHAPPRCQPHGDGVMVAHVLEAADTHHVVTASASGTVPPDTLDGALAALTRAGVPFRRDELDVR